MSQAVTVIGGGLAGCEAAWQAARLGAEVTLYEMRPTRTTPAHQTADLAELVCSNSLGTTQKGKASAMLKDELRRLGSLLLQCAESTAVPAGSALAVDRHAFRKAVTRAIASHPHIRIERREVTSLDAGAGVLVCASGPLTSPALAEAIARLTGRKALGFYDAMAPIVLGSSVDAAHTYRATRYGLAGSDYICCPLTKEQYDAFIDALLMAEGYPLPAFERLDKRFFEACLPIEVLAARGRETLAYGPMRAVGLRDPRTGQSPYAVAQLRQDDLAATLYNLVGFQTNLRQSEQKRVFALIPGLEHAEWVRYGQMHRNTYLQSPAVLQATLQARAMPQILFAGQLAGTEGYLGSIASGLLAGLNAARLAAGMEPLTAPRTTMWGALMHYISHSTNSPFQPMKANLGLLPLPNPLGGDHHRQLDAIITRSEVGLLAFLYDNQLPNAME